MADKPYTAATLAERWGVSSTFIYTLIQSGELPGFKLGNKLWRIKPEAVAEYEQRHVENAEPPVADAKPDLPKPGREVRDASFRLARKST